MWVERVAENRIQEAIAQGAFENLSGVGEPLQLEDDFNVDPAWRSAFRILKDAGMMPTWIEMQVEIRHRRKVARQLLERACANLPQGTTIPEGVWTRFKDEIEQTNALIINLNLRVPALSLQRPQLDPERESRRIRRMAG